VELMNAKLHLAKKFLYQTASSQTDIHIPPSEINGRVFANCIMLSDEQQQQQKVGDEVSEGQNPNSKLKSDLDDLLRDIKSSNSDYTYDATSKTYYSRSTGWYYYPVCWWDLVENVPRNPNFGF